MNRNILRAVCVLILTFLLLYPQQKAFALYEVVTPAPTNATTGDTPQQPPAEPLLIEWTAPTLDNGISIVSYIYYWDNSSALSSFDNNNKDGSTSQIFLQEDVSRFASSDYANINGPDVYYCHIKTSYFSDQTGPALSNDSVVGPFYFDNTAPTGTISLDLDTTGQTSSSSSINPIYLDVVPKSDTVWVYLSENADFTVKSTYAYPPESGTLDFIVSTGSGSKIVYAKFEDRAGNVLTTPVSLSFTMIAGKSIDPSGNNSLEIGAEQTFSVLGAGEGETFDWAITGDPSNTVSFVGSNTGVASVTVKGDNEGTFVITATASDQSTYDSGSWTVIPASTEEVTINVSDGFNLVCFPLIKDDASIQTVIGDQLPGNFISSNAARLYDYNSITGVFDQYFYYSNTQGTIKEWRKVGQSTATDFEVSPDKGYWINLPSNSGALTIKYQGMPPSSARTINLTAGFNLVGSAYNLDYQINNSNFTNGTGNFISSNADRTYFYDKVNNVFVQYFYYSNTQGTIKEWRKVGETTATTDSFVATHGFWINAKNVVTWTFE